MSSQSGKDRRKKESEREREREEEEEGEGEREGERKVWRRRGWRQCGSVVVEDKEEKGEEDDL
eukprot:450886-Hanusia_phi.AAC.2